MEGNAKVGLKAETNQSDKMLDQTRGHKNYQSSAPRRSHQNISTESRLFLSFDAADAEEDSI